MNLLQFTRHFLVPKVLGIMYNGTLYICEGLKWAIFMLTFSFFIKVTASLLDASVTKKWTSYIKVLTMMTSLAYVVYGIQYFVITERVNNGKRTSK